MMDSKQMQFVVDRVFPFVSGCPEATIRAVAEAAVSEYVTDIGGIHTWTNPAPFDAKDGNYRLSAPFGGRVTNVRAVQVGGEVIPHDRYRIAAYGDDMLISFSGFDSPVVHMCGDGFLWSAKVSWEPTELTTMLPTEWFRRHFRAIRSGTLAKLLSMGNAWGNPQNAALFIAEHDNCVKDALISVRMEEAPGGKPSVIGGHNPFLAGL